MKKPMKPSSSRKDKTSLRKRAEELLKKQTERLDGLSRTDVKTLVHELGTHQIELEIQNEELRRAQVELEVSLRKYADLYDLSPVGYMTFSDQGLVLDANLTAGLLLGRSKRSLLNRPFREFIEGRDRKEFDLLYSVVLETGQKRTIEVKLLRADGTAFPAQLESIAVEEPGGREKTVSVRTAISDITERKFSEEQLRAAHAELKHRAYDLDAVNRELEAFSYVVSHDLKAPLRSIEGFTRALREDYAEALDETGRDYLARVNSASRRMTQLIDALLSMARITRGELHEKTVNLGSLARVIEHDLRKQDRRRQAEFVIADNLTARGDQEMLQVVLENLLDNAWKFTSRQASAKIEFEAVNMDGKKVFVVRDNGAGFDMAYADKLFHPFKRLHQENEFPGIGIGLAIVHRIISRHNGRIWAEGAPEKGAAFYFTLG